MFFLSLVCTTVEVVNASPFSIITASDPFPRKIRILSKSLQSFASPAESLRDNPIHKKRMKLHTGFSADGWKVRFVQVAMALPAAVAETALQEFYQQALDDLVEATSLEQLLNDIVGRTVALGGPDSFWIKFRSPNAMLSTAFIKTMLQILLEAAQNHWAPFFHAEVTNPANNVLVFVSLEPATGGTTRQSSLNP